MVSSNFPKIYNSMDPINLILNKMNSKTAQAKSHNPLYVLTLKNLLYYITE